MNEINLPKGARCDSQIAQTASLRHITAQAGSARKPPGLRRLSWCTKGGEVCPDAESSFLLGHAPKRNLLCPHPTTPWRIRQAPPSLWPRRTFPVVPQFLRLCRHEIDGT